MRFTTSLALWARVPPSRSIFAVISLTPGKPNPSPAWMTTRSSTIGSARDSTTDTRSPFRSVVLSTFGNGEGLLSRGGGGASTPALVVVVSVPV